MKSSIHNDSYLDKKNKVHYSQLNNNKEDNQLIDTESNKVSERVQERKEKRYTEYKGVHYKKEKSVRYYEHGAHFKYQELYDILNSLLKVEIETNCETANFTDSNNTKTIFTENPYQNKTNKSIKFKEKDESKNENKLENNKESSKIQSSLLLPTNLKSNINNLNNNLLIKDEENIKFRKSGPVNTNHISNNNNLNPYNNIQSKVKQAFNLGEVKEKEKKITVLPPINQKIQNLELVTSKIDTGLKSYVPIKKGNITKIQILIFTIFIIL
jgi:hypothetical protein